MKTLHHLYGFLGGLAAVRGHREVPAQAEWVASQCEITSRVETALASDPGLVTCPIHVEVCGDVAELSGYANSEAEIRRTVAIISAIYPAWAWSETSSPMPGGSTHGGTTVRSARLYRIRFLRGPPESRLSE